MATSDHDSAQYLLYAASSRGRQVYSLITYSYLNQLKNDSPLNSPEGWAM